MRHLSYCLPEFWQSWKSQHSFLLLFWCNYFQDSLLAVFKGHGNEADFPMFLHKSFRHRSLTLHFEPFRFWLRTRGDIRNRQTTTRLGESGSRQFSNSASWGVAASPTRRVGESAIECSSVSWGVVDSPTRQVKESLTLRLGELGESLWWVATQNFLN